MKVVSDAPKSWRQIVAYISLYASLVHDFVDFVGRNAGLRRSCSYIQYLSSHFAHLSHAFLFFLVEYFDLVSTNKDLHVHQHTPHSQVASRFFLTCSLFGIPLCA